MGSRWVAARCDPYHDEVPETPQELILGTASVYIEAYETSTGQRFALPEGDGPELQRVRANLRPYFTRRTGPFNQAPSHRPHPANPGSGRG